LAHVNDAVIVVDFGSYILEWNAAAERIYGWSASEVQGRTLGEIVRPRYLNGETDAEAFAALERDGVWIGLVAQRHRDGHEVLIESAVRRLRDASGQVIGLVGINRDVSARAATEAALRRSEANLRAVFESAPEAHFLLDPQFRILAFNRVAAEQVRRIWQRELVVGDSMLTYSNPADRNAFIANARRCLQGEAIRHERPITYPSGRTIWYEVAYTPVVQAGDGTISGLTFSGLDVTARKQTELALAHREAQLAGIIDSAMDAIITVDAEQRVVRFNRAAEQVFGCTAADVLGQPLDRFIPSELRTAHRQHIPAFGETGVTRRSMHSPGVLEALRADGTHFPIEASISQITVEGERFYTVILRDISQRHELEAQLLHAQKLESVGQLAGGVAHDFNNLLTVIGGITELMREELPGGHPLQADLAEVSLTTERAVALTRQLLAFARRQVLAPHVLDLNELLQEAAPLLHRLLGEDVEIILDLRPGPILVRADPNQLQQVLINLAVNARDAMPDGGYLRISTRLITDVDEVDDAPGGISTPVARITVQDTGTGMSPEVQARVFEPFYTTKAPGQGTGLGLATSYGIVTQHNGRITVSSRVGEGSTFTISLPITDAQLEARAPHIAADMPGGSETIMLVEDELAVRTFVERVLRGLGYVVLSAANGLEALRLARHDTSIDLLVTDMVMPELSGPALVARLTSERPTLRVIYMSANSERAIPSGEPAVGVHLLQKPFPISTLARLVRAVLDGQA
jgi:PAS domain S-box-containing protein